MWLLYEHDIIRKARFLGWVPEALLFFPFLGCVSNFCHILLSYRGSAGPTLVALISCKHFWLGLGKERVQTNDKDCCFVLHIATQ